MKEFFVNFPIFFIVILTYFVVLLVKVTLVGKPGIEPRTLVYDTIVYRSISFCCH